MVENSYQEGMGLTITIPTKTRLFRYKGAEKVLLILCDNPYSEYSIRRLSRLTGMSHPAIKNAVDVLQENELIDVEALGNKKKVSINRERLTKPEDPILQIPQLEFHKPVRNAVNRLKESLHKIRGILIFGSVARGEGDRQSDIDMWILVQSDRGTNQRKANEIAKDLGTEVFDGDRYEFQILVESSRSALNYKDRLQEVLSSGITLYSTDTLQTFKEEIDVG